MDLDKNVWPIYLDSSDLEDALLNLTINAMHAMETGGELTISTRNKLLGRREVINTNLTAGEYVEINVSDTGAGIDAETQEKIFDPFFTTKGDGGVGLGLSMVYGFVQRSGGDITVQSVPGQGASFVLYFPRFKQTVVSKPEISVVDDKELLGDESILVVDDEPAMLELMKEILAAKGYKVLTAKDGRAALDVLKREKIDLLVSDVIMPEMDGFELAAKIQDEYPATKIQLVSGFAENRHKIVEDPELNRRLLQKPFTAQVLRHRVREILDGHSQPKKINKPTIMVMDDEENVRELFRVNLEKLGYETVLVSNGEQAIGRYQDSLKSDKPIEAVIMDLQIQGGMDGLDAARGILAIDHRAKLIVSSGDSYGQVMSNFREHGFQAAIEKTFDRENMEKVITQVLLAK